MERGVSQERSEAVVLRSVDFSETSRIVTFLTPGRGRVACLAKGARRPKSPLAGALDTLNRLEIVYYWKESRSVQNLAEASLLDRYTGVKNVLEKSVYAAVAAEIALHAARENEPSEELYACVTRGLSSLARWPGDERAHACWQMVQLLLVAGFAPAYEFCAGCGSAVDEHAGFSFEGGVTCAQCRADRRLTPQDRERLGALLAAGDLCPEIGDARGIYELLRQYAMRQLETDLRSARVVDEVLRNNRD
jgi:DNA repair protein RecO (recombination protein O)